MHHIVKAVLSSNSLIEYCDVVTETCMIVIQSDSNDWTYGYSNAHYAFVKVIVVYIIDISVPRNSVYTTRSIKLNDLHDHHSNEL